MEYNPENIDAKVNLANAYAAAGDKETAVKKIRSAYLLDKKNPKIIFMYAVLLLKNDEFYDAIEKFEAAYKLDNSMFLAEFGKIECLIKLKKPKEALGLLENYENKYGENKEFLLLKVIAYLKLLDISEDAENKYLIKTTIEVCDKIFSIHGECEPWIIEKYGELKQKLEKKEE